MNDVATSLLLVIGAAFMLLAGLGLVRMPDVYMRTQAATKAATLGASCALMSVAVHFGELTVVTRAALITAFVLLTAPVSAHMIARAAHSVGTPLWDRTIADELRHGDAADRAPASVEVSERSPPAEHPSRQDPPGSAPPAAEAP